MYYSLIVWRSCWSCVINDVLWNEENGQLSFFSEYLLNFFFLSKDPFQVVLMLFFSASWNLLNTLIPYFSAFQEWTWAILAFVGSPYSSLWEVAEMLQDTFAFVTDSVCIFHHEVFSPLNMRPYFETKQFSWTKLYVILLQCKCFIAF